MTLQSLIVTLIVTSLILLCAWGFGRLAFSLFRHGLEPSQKLFFSLSFGIGFIAWIMFLLALIGLWYRLVAWAFIAAGLLCLIVSFRKSKPLNYWRPQKKKVLRWISDWGNWPIIALLLVTFGIVLWILLTHALLPPIEWDEISYHLALPKLYIQNHRFIYIPYIVHANWPLLTDFSYGLPLMMASCCPSFNKFISDPDCSLWPFHFSAKYMQKRIGLIVIVNLSHDADCETAFRNWFD